jgi:hypothetical protein
MAAKKEGGALVGYILLGVLGLVLLPTFPAWIALMTALWPVVLVVGLLVVVVRALAR